jgi:hypothetical protein
MLSVTRMKGLMLRAILPAVLATAVLAACNDVAAPTPRVSPSPPTAVASPSPATSPPARTARPTPAPWPERWDIEFCSAFTEVAIAQELVVDIERAIAEEEREDALALARELRGTTTVAEELLGVLEEWAPAQDALSGMASLMDVDDRIGRQYIRWLDGGRNPARRRARELADETKPIVRDVNSALAQLTEIGVRCSDRDLLLESP